LAFLFNKTLKHTVFLRFLYISQLIKCLKTNIRQTLSTKVLVKHPLCPAFTSTWVNPVVSMVSILIFQFAVFLFLFACQDFYSLWPLTKNRWIYIKQIIVQTYSCFVSYNMEYSRGLDTHRFSRLAKSLHVTDWIDVILLEYKCLQHVKHKLNTMKI
jgi:hypothetical protein